MATWPHLRRCVSMMQTPCYAGAEVLFECGGAYAGTCNVTSGSCVCNDGWSGHSDIVPLDYGGRVLSCPVHVATIKVMWAVVLIPLAAFIYLYPSSLKTAWATYLRKRRDDPLQYMIVFNMVCTTPVYWISMVALVVLKLADNGGTALVGVHFAPTLLFALNTFCFIWLGISMFLRALKGAIMGAVHLPSTAGQGGGDSRSQPQKTLHRLYVVFLAVTVPCMFQDVPLLVSVAYPSEILVDGAPLDDKRVAAAAWICVQLVGTIVGGALSWYTANVLADFFKPLLQFSTSMDDRTRLKVTTLRDSSVGAHRGFVKTCGIMLLVGLVVRVPTPWWTITQSYWLPISKCLQALNAYKSYRVFTTKRVTSMISLRMTTPHGRTTTTGSTRPDMTGGELASIAPTAAEGV